MDPSLRVLGPTRRAALARAWREGLPGTLGAWRLLLGPAAGAYGWALRARRAAYALGLRHTRALPCRVVAVGNLTVGGTGKTPLVELVARGLAARGRRVVVVSRGYGRRSGGGVRVVSDGATVALDARDAGDEPVLLARRLSGVPVVVGRDRFLAGVEAIARFRPDVLLLDDGFQQMRLRADVRIVCLDARAPFGRGGLLPAGTLREPPGALARADLLVLTGDGPDAAGARAVGEVRAVSPAAPLALATREPEDLREAETGVVRPLAAVRGLPVAGFAGIAAPESFRATLHGLGADLRLFAAFPDHHAYRPDELASLAARARTSGAAALLTTEKDAMRLPGGTGLPVWALRIRLSLRGEGGAGPQAWWAALERALGLS